LVFKAGNAAEPKPKEGKRASFEGDTGPEHRGASLPEFSLCDSGKNQSFEAWVGEASNRPVEPDQARLILE